MLSQRGLVNAHVLSNINIFTIIFYFAVVLGHNHRGYNWILEVIVCVVYNVIYRFPSETVRIFLSMQSILLTGHVHRKRNWHLFKCSGNCCATIQRILRFFMKHGQKKKGIFITFFFISYLLTLLRTVFEVTPNDVTFLIPLLSLTSPTFLVVIVLFTRTLIHFWWPYPCCVLRNVISIFGPFRLSNRQSTRMTDLLTLSFTFQGHWSGTRVEPY